MRKTFEIEPFLGETVPVELVNNMLDFQFTDRTATITCELQRVRPLLYGSYGTLYENVYLPLEDAGTASIRLDLCTPEILRVRFAPGDDVPSNTLTATGNTPMVVVEFEEPVEVGVHESAESVRLTTDSLRIVLQRHPWQMRIFSLNASQPGQEIFSTRARGIPTSFPITAHMGDLTGTAYSLILHRCPALDYYFIYGPTLKEILPRYTQITGQPRLPPKWTFGHWMSRLTYKSQPEVEQVASELRAHRIPTDVIHIDTGWFTEEASCDLRFDPVKFPDPAGMAQRLHEQGFRLSVWQWPTMLVGNPMCEEAQSRGFLVKRSDKKAYYWVDYWTKKVLSGGRWLDVEASLDVLPMWVRAGAIVPMGPEQQHVDEKPLDPLTLELYAPGQAGAFTIYDEGRPQNQVGYNTLDRVSEGETHLVVSTGPTAGQVELICYGLWVQAASVNGATVQVEECDPGQLVRFDGQAGSQVELTVASPGG